MFDVIAVISLFVGFAALYMASDARHRVNTLAHEFLNSNIHGVHNKVADNDKKIGELAAQLGKLAKALRAAEEARVESEKSFSSMKAEIQNLRAELDQLDQSIPPRFRVRVHAAQSH